MSPRQFVPQRVVEAAQAFVHLEASSGVVLLIAAVAALVWANSPWDSSYTSFWHKQIVVDTPVFSIEEDLRHWVNDGLMALFFFLMGLEIKRELVHGELATPRQALLPATAALGGMIAPALIYAAFNQGGPGSDGWGIPMATDIAFALGVLSLLGRRIPFGVKVFLLGLAIADDIGAIVVIAVFYTASISGVSLALAFAILGLVIALNRGGVRNVNVYAILGAALWVALFESGVHATLAGVALGLLTPASAFYRPESFSDAAERLTADYRSSLENAREDELQGLLAQLEDLSQGTEPPLNRLERAFHPWVSFLVVPLFALANAGVKVSGDVVSDAVESPISLGVALGLLLGKPAGIVLLTWLAVRLRLCSLPSGATWRQIVGVGLLGGIGFTVSLLVTDLAFDDELLADEARLGVLAGSLVAGIAGYVFLWLSGNHQQDAAVTAGRH